MGKAPAFQFYVKDWLSDAQLRQTSSSTKGIWIDLICFMWENEKCGKLTAEAEVFCRMTGTTMSEFEIFLKEAKKLKFCDFSVTSNVLEQKSNALITIKNRRMYREWKKSNDNKLRQSKFREKHNGKKNYYYS